MFFQLVNQCFAFYIRKIRNKKIKDIPTLSTIFQVNAKLKIIYNLAGREEYNIDRIVLLA